MARRKHNARTTEWMRRYTAAHPLYRRWLNIRQRCGNPNHPRYADWGGRGIFLAECWNDFETFERDLMALANALRPGYSLDRIDNDGFYAPGNVRWSTAAEQRRNQRREPWPFGVLMEEKEDAYGMTWARWAEEQAEREAVA